jgi:predicted transcriptional regulator
VREARRRAGLTQTELAQRLSVKQPVVARLERGGANPRCLTLDRVIAATGHSLEVGLAGPSGIDPTMIAADLELTHDDRLRRFESFYRFARDTGRQAKRTSGP